MNDAYFSNCRFSADIVPYMYGELDGSESSVFESHLLDCGDCTDEFAAISGARYEIYEWKKLAFDPLATPSFTIPFEHQGAIAASTAWFGKLRSAVAAGWATPAFALGGLIIVSMFAASFILTGDDGTTVAVNNSNARPVDTANGTAEVPKNMVTVGGEDEAPVEPRKRAGGATRISVQGPTEPRRPGRVSRVVQPRTIEPKAASARNKPVDLPRLNEFAEDEDTSLRLAELLDDIETSD